MDKQIVDINSAYYWAKQRILLDQASGKRIEGHADLKTLQSRMNAIRTRAALPSYHKKPALVLNASVQAYNADRRAPLYQRIGEHLRNRSRVVWELGNSDFLDDNGEASSLFDVTGPRYALLRQAEYETACIISLILEIRYGADFLENAPTRDLILAGRRLRSENDEWNIFGNGDEFFARVLDKMNAGTWTW